MSYGFKKTVNRSVAEAEETVRSALQNHGFGVLTKIDMSEKFKEKLDVDFKSYVILGACNPSNAYAAVQAEEDIGLLLPCNVIIYQTGPQSTVSFVKPTVSMQMIENDRLKALAEEVETKLYRAFEEIS
ncbi:MAG: DUF302 domain-containing protein [Chitinivibrionales bacterium]|nr:DUF302 domain-containing protein [Chitinivibrionales bacterium]MBD3356559.1 DUF302 domain-containing protein [Chitinivibrionales bacterium]